MKFCERCLYPDNHALGITFNKKNVCSGCIVHEEKYQIDWKEKEKKLSTFLDQYKKKINSNYDCIIPVSGTGDDFFVVETIKKKYEMNPLLVTYNTHFNTSVGVRNLSQLITKLDCDHMMSTVGPDTIKEITRQSFSQNGDIYWHVLAGNYTFPVQVATKLNIPLIIWGVNGWLDQVAMFSHFDNVEMTKKVRKEHGLRRFNPSNFLKFSKNLSKKDLQAFTYPSDKQLESSRVRGIYLGNFIFWDSQKQIEKVIQKYNYETIPQERTYNTYESIHCWNNAGVHDYIKYLKYGYAKVNDHVSRDIRLKRLNRLQGLELIDRYIERIPSSFQKFLDWLEIDEAYFYKTVNKFRDNRAWRKTKNGSWRRINKIDKTIVSKMKKSNELKKIKEREYVLTDSKEKENSEYILLGRTYSDEKNFKALGK